MCVINICKSCNVINLQLHLMKLGNPWTRAVVHSSMQLRQKGVYSSMQSTGKLIRRKPEIMSPAGDMVSLRAGLSAGCDAVYFGVGTLNMRATAGNFREKELGVLAELCDAAGVRKYLALNTIIYEQELVHVQSLLRSAKDAGIDAVICSDFAVISEACRIGLPVFISTQMSVSNSSGLLFLYRTFGVKRFVLARECTLEDIAAIRFNLKKELGEAAEDIELEVFIHGAMCVSVSGRCFLSQFQYGKSANRGECLQPCRREYGIINEDEDQSFTLGNNYILSPKDICAMPFIEKLIESGVNSFKIEGRNRKPEYVSIVTAAYREAVDYYFAKSGCDDFDANFSALKKRLMDNMAAVYHRGFSSGFFLGKPLNEWTDGDGSKSTKVKVYSGIVTNYYKKPGVAEILVHNAPIQVGDELLFTGETTGVVFQKAESMEVEHQRVEKAEREMLVALKTDCLVRRGDKLFVLIDRD